MLDASAGFELGSCASHSICESDSDDSEEVDLENIEIEIEVPMTRNVPAFDHGVEPVPDPDVVRNLGGVGNYYW